MLCAAVAAAQETKEEEKLPTGEEIILRAIEASGGMEALAKIKNRVAEGTMEIKGLGIKGKLTVCQARPNKTYTKVQIDGLGTLEQGTDGDVVWELNPMTGPRVVEGEERAAMLLISQFDDANFKELYEKIECVGTEDVGDETCYKVVLTPKEAMPITEYHSKQSGLLVKQVLTLPHQFGKIEIESVTSDYKKVDGILLPHRTVEKALVVESHATVTGYKHNVELPDDRFDPPAQIKALLKRALEKDAEGGKEEDTPAGKPEE
jgi:hypothetical protein